MLPGLVLHGGLSARTEVKPCVRRVVTAGTSCERVPGATLAERDKLPGCPCDSGVGGIGSPRLW